MEFLKPYWFLEEPLDAEHKYYKLMSFLTDIKKSFNKSGYYKKIKSVLNLKTDLISFVKDMEFSQKTNAGMTESERDIFYKLLEKNVNNEEEIKKIVDLSIKTLEDFIDENVEHFEKYKSLVSIETYCKKYNLWDQGVLVVRKKSEENLKVFTWFFSMVKIGDKDNVALLMSEIIDPVCKNTKQIKSIKTFLDENVENFSEESDCFILADISEKIDMETGTEISKEKSIELIVKNFKNS
jgi:hypothetical protein